MKFLFAACAALSLAAAPALAGQADDPQIWGEAAQGDAEAIRAAVMDYFEGQGEHSRERLERAFDPAAAMTYLRDGAVTATPIPDIIDRWSEGEPDGAARDSEILEMDIVDGRMASVLFDSDGRFYDQLTLLKVGGEWKIVAKVFIPQDEE